MSGRLSFIRGNALALPLADQSVALIVTSPPYFGLRSYRDEGEHCDGQLGSEPTPFLFLANLWAVMDEAWRVLRDDGNAWVNLGDKFAGSRPDGSSGNGLSGSTLKHDGRKAPRPGTERQAALGASRQTPSARSSGGLRAKTRMALPHRFYEGCIDPKYRAFTEQRAGFDHAETEQRLTLAPEDGGYPQWVGRLDVVWSKANGMPSSAQDRCRDSHEYWFHLTKSERYFSALDEVREEHTSTGASQRTTEHYNTAERYGANNGGNAGLDRFAQKMRDGTALGKPPGSVWEFPSEPLVGVPEFMVLDDPDSLHPTEYLRSASDAWAWVEERGVDCSAWPRSAGVGPQLYAMPDHFAAFGSQMVKRIILGWSPSGVCVACGDPRQAVCDRVSTPTQRVHNGRSTAMPTSDPKKNWAGKTLPKRTDVTITGYACSCPTPTAPTTPARILDPFSGTGTTAVVAAALGRHGIGVELSADYLRLARWRDEDGGLRCKALGVEKPPRQVRGQEALF